MTLLILFGGSSGVVIAVDSVLSTIVTPDKESAIMSPDGDTIIETPDKTTVVKIDGVISS